jgi:hypothetical protein
MGLYEHHVQRELLGYRRLDAPAIRAREAQHPGVKSIGPPSMRVNTRFVLVQGGLTGSPQALYSMPRAPSRTPSWVGAAQPRVLDGLVRIDGNVALGRFLHHQQVMARLHLPVVPLEWIGPSAPGLTPPASAT